MKKITKKTDIYSVTEGLQFTSEGKQFNTPEAAQAYCLNIFNLTGKVLNITTVHADKRKRNSRFYFPIDFKIIDKYSKGPDSEKKIFSIELTESEIASKFYPFCTKVIIATKTIEIIPCEYSRLGNQITKACEIVK